MSLKTILYVSLGFFLAALVGLPLDELAKPLLFGSLLVVGFSTLVGFKDIASAFLKYGVVLGAFATVWSALAQAMRRAVQGSLARAQASLPRSGILEQIGFLDWILVIIVGLVILWLVGRFVLARATAQLDGAFKHDPGPAKLRPRYRADPPPTYESPRFPLPAEKPVSLFEDRG